MTIRFTYRDVYKRQPLYNHNIKVENSVLFYNYRNTGTLGYYGEVYGDVTLSGDCTIKNGQTLFIPTGCSLTVNGTLDNQGTIYSKGALTANQITGNTAVSYTHLDVYKRQLPNRL